MYDNQYINNELIILNIYSFKKNMKDLVKNKYNGNYTELSLINTFNLHTIFYSDTSRFKIVYVCDYFNPSNFGDLVIELSRKYALAISEKHVYVLSNSCENACLTDKIIKDFKLENIICDTGIEICNFNGFDKSSNVFNFILGKTIYIIQ